MDSVIESVSRAAEQLLGRASGPMHFRLVIQPTIATLLAIRAGIRDAREGFSPFLYAFRKVPGERKRLLASTWKDIGMIFTVAITLDLVYQILVLHGIYVVQTLLVAVTVAVLPYVLLRGIVSRLVRGRAGR